MLVGFGKVKALFIGAVVLGGLAMPAVAQDFHSQGGHAIYPRIHGTGFANGVGRAGGFDFHGRNPRLTGDGDRFRHRGFGNDGRFRGMTAQNDMRGDRHDGRFDHSGYSGRFRANHIPAIASRDVWMRRGSGTAVIDRRQSDFDIISNYSGSTDVYRADGGTYITGYGDGGDNTQGGVTTRPCSKVIDVARMHDACAHENGVCVIRP